MIYKWFVRRLNVFTTSCSAPNLHRHHYKNYLIIGLHEGTLLLLHLEGAYIVSSRELNLCFYFSLFPARSQEAAIGDGQLWKNWINQRSTLNNNTGVRIHDSRIAEWPKTTSALNRDSILPTTMYVRNDQYMLLLRQS